MIKNFLLQTEEDEIDASLNLETVAPTTSRRDYYRSKVMGVKTRLSKLLTGKKKRKGMYRDETKVGRPPFPTGGVCLLYIGFLKMCR